MELRVTDKESRLVVNNDHWVALVPWWATWPFEIMGEAKLLARSSFIRTNTLGVVLPHQRHISSIASLSAPEKLALAEILAKITKKYDNLFTCSFAYSMGIHQRPVPPSHSHPEGSQDGDGDEEDVAHLHFHFAPPLLRSASVKKFLVGWVRSIFRYLCLTLMVMMSYSFELMAEAQRDLTPEQAAERLRSCAEDHYLDSS
jgi:UDPglucose--hexose-1-phosphate uridylyltransferase